MTKRQRLIEKWEHWVVKVQKIQNILKLDPTEDEFRTWSDRAVGIMTDGLDLVGEIMEYHLIPTEEEED